MRKAENKIVRADYVDRQVITIPQSDFERFVQVLNANVDPNPAILEDATIYAEGQVEGDRYSWQ